MGERVEDTIREFAELHQGGRLAQDIDGEFRPWKVDGEPVPATEAVLRDAALGHIDGHTPLGVYPIADPAAAGDSLVRWGAVDWDVGDEDSFIHAVNTHCVLSELDIAAWIELSRSKGCHLWVYANEWVSARVMREAMLAACQIVDAPVTEIYPKQPTTNGGWGNGLRLPYPAIRPMGRQCVVRNDAGRYGIPVMDAYPLGEWTGLAHANRTDAEPIEALAHRYVRPEPVRAPSAPVRALRSHHEGDLKGLANHIWNNGPRRGPKGNYDRSAMMHTFACELFRQGYLVSSIEILVAHLDRRWGKKYSGREDGAQRIKELVSRAQSIYNQPSLLEGESRAR